MILPEAHLPEYLKKCLDVPRFAVHKHTIHIENNCTIRVHIRLKDLGQALLQQPDALHNSLFAGQFPQPARRLIESLEG